MKKLYLAILIILFVVNILQARNSKEEIFNSLKSKYGNIESVVADFALSTNQKIKGKFWAKSGNKYIMQMDNRIITCNGTNLWNYSIKQNNVVISSFDKMSEEVSVEKIMFDLLNEYKVLEAKTELASKGKKQLLILLEKNKKDGNANLNKVKIWVDANNYSINSIGIDRGGEFEIWNLTNMKINTKIEDSRFEFKTPKNAEEIDLR